jgi:hypothetical protein
MSTMRHPEQNGSPVTWRELGLALHPVREALAEVKDEIAELRADLAASKYIAESRALLGPRGRLLANGIIVSVPAALIGALVTLIASR